MSIFRISDYTAKNQKITSIKTKLPTQTKSKPVFCRNCGKQNTETAKICTQCDVTIRIPKLRRRLR